MSRIGSTSPGSKVIPLIVVGVASVFALIASCKVSDHVIVPSPADDVIVPAPAMTGPKLVRGYLAATVARSTTDQQILMAASIPLRDVFIPGVDVFLRDLSNNTDGPTVKTDLSGRFTLPVKNPGRYQLCWKAIGFVSECFKNPVSVANQNVHLGTVRMTVDRRARNTTVVHGQVRMKDGAMPRFLEPLAGLNAFATVDLLDGGGTRIHTVYVNNFGDYLLPAVPTGQRVTLRARIEGASSDQPIFPEANLAGAMFHPIPLVIGNTAPRVDPVVPTTAAGVRVKVAAPGSSVRLEARAFDPEGDPLKFQWLVADGSGLLSATSGTSVTWTLPGQPGRYAVNLHASDGKGGYATSSLSLRADNLGIPFSGYVRGTDAPAVAGAQVEINGQTTFTGAEGFFRIRVRDARRFVFNVRKPGYALVSRIYDNGVTGGEWTMTRATVTSINPTITTEVINRRSSRECPGPRANRLNWKAYPGLRPQWQDGKSNVIAPAGRLEVPLPTDRKQEQGCGPGIRVTIPANSLQDSNGQAPAGNVDVTVSTVDLNSPEQMPGDYTVRLPSGDTRVMQSWGAGTVEVTAGGNRYNLKPGSTATVVIPVDRAQLAVGAPLPPTIPLLFYNERDGVWVEEGTATLNGNEYVATVRHFSAINVDLVKTNQSCVRVLSPAIGLSSYNLEITIPMGGGAAPLVTTTFIDNTSPSEHVIYNLPSNTNIVLVPIRIADTTPLGMFVVNTGGPQNPTNPNRPAGPPYVACSTQVTLSELVVPEEPSFGLEFLHGLYSFAASNLNELAVSDPALATALDTATGNYYTQIDPRGKRLDLTGFRTTNGFGGPSEIRAIYANSGDLGFGRDMHCNKQVASDGLFDVACYVTNYGNILTPDSDDVADAVIGTDPVATVAMEYSRIESDASNPTEFDDPVRVVKFYVYSGDGTTLLRSADLDSGLNLRARPIPQLCMVCHSGEYPGGAVTGAAPPFNDRDDVKLNSRFLPFDLRYFTFAPAPNDKASQQAKFKQLNEDIVKNTPPDPAIADMISQMYTPGPDQNENFVVSGWNAQPIQRGMYRDVVAGTCRTCHVAQVFPALKFDQSSQFVDRLGSIENRVCVEHVMPHAKVTHKIFWTSVSPHMPAQLQIFGDTFGSGLNGWNGTLCGQFTAGGVTPPSLYTPVQDVWNSRCTGCHTGASPPPSSGGLNLTAALSHGQLVNIPASELPSMMRVAPNNTAQSYLWHKINNTQGTLAGPFVSPGPGSRMPPGCAIGTNCLFDTGQTAPVETWINNGAPPP